MLEVPLLFLEQRSKLSDLQLYQNLSFSNRCLKLIISVDNLYHSLIEYLYAISGILLLA